MPCDYTVDPERHLVWVRASGVFSFAELLETRQRFMTEPAFSPDLNLLYDLTAVSRLDMTVDEIRRMGRFSPLVPTIRRAVVATDDAVYGVLRMVAIQHEASGGQNAIGVFRKFEEAERWITDGDGKRA